MTEPQTREPEPNQAKVDATDQDNPEEPITPEKFPPEEEAVRAESVTYITRLLP